MRVYWKLIYCLLKATRQLVMILFRHLKNSIQIFLGPTSDNYDYPHIENLWDTFVATINQVGAFVHIIFVNVGGRVF